MNTAIEHENRNVLNIIESVRFGTLDDLVTALHIAPDTINMQDDMGLTALHWAAHLRQFKAAECLLNTGNVDIYIRDNNGKTLMDHALSGGHEKIISLILHHQEKQESDTPR